MENMALANDATAVERSTVYEDFSETKLFRQEAATSAKKRRHLKNNIKGWLFSVWPLIGWIIFAGIPFVLSLVMSMTDLHAHDFAQMKWNSFANYNQIFTQSSLEFWYGMRATIYYCISLPMGIVLGLGMAVLLTRGIKLTRLYRTILFIPNVCSIVAVSTMWSLVFNGTEQGVLNSLMASFVGEGYKNIQWLRGDLFMPVVLFTTTWSAGSGSLMFQAALEQVNKSLVEAAKIDGADGTRCFFKVVLPAISPTTFYVLTMNTIGALQQMATVQIMAGQSGEGRGPYDPVTRASMSQTVVYLVYYMTFEGLYKYGPGLASSCAWVLAIIIFVMTRVNFKLSDYWVHYDD